MNSSPQQIEAIQKEIGSNTDFSITASHLLEYLFCPRFTYKTYRTHLVFYAQLIKDNFDVPVNRGYIVYTRSRNKLVEVPIQEKDFVELEKIIDEIVAVIQKCRYPKPTKYKRRCPDCCYRNLCERTI